MSNLIHHKLWSCWSIGHGMAAHSMLSCDYDAWFSQMQTVVHCVSSVNMLITDIGSMLRTFHIHMP